MQTYSTSGCDFIDDAKFAELLQTKAEPGRVRDIIAKSLEKKPLDLEETAVLLAADAPETVERIFDAARQLKHDDRFYGRSRSKFLTFAPLLIGGIRFFGFVWRKNFYAFDFRFSFPSTIINEFLWKF